MKTFLKNTFVVWGTLVMVVVIFGITASYYLDNKAQNNSLLATVSYSHLPQMINGLPLHLRIPTINVDASVEYVGVGADGTMGTPQGPDTVAWYSLGPRPGETGNAVIDGHYGWKDNTPAVFDNLKKLQTGDKIYVEDENGLVINFVVRETREYDPKADAAYIFSSDDRKSHRNLITCEGPWNRNTASRPSRLVVFADKI
ncbi:MAG: class F sortase [Candidatus Paceibacterota bacterium]|jgi:LPXTG-site transpeptidase (sortase) family protein